MWPDDQTTGPPLLSPHRGVAMDPENILCYVLRLREDFKTLGKSVGLTDQDAINEVDASLIVLEGYFRIICERRYQRAAVTAQLRRGFEDSLAEIQPDVHERNRLVNRFLEQVEPFLDPFAKSKAFNQP